MPAIPAGALILKSFSHLLALEEEATAFSQPRLPVTPVPQDLAVPADNLFILI
ncbi:MAG: hypothetical protein ACOC57_05025 [Acidobacteriota bacterium]